MGGERRKVKRNRGGEAGKGESSEVLKVGMRRHYDHNLFIAR